jgi:hypothetical protein
MAHILLSQHLQLSSHRTTRHSAGGTRIAEYRRCWLQEHGECPRRVGGCVRASTSAAGTKKPLADD